MIDVIEQAYHKVKNRKTGINKVLLLRRYLKMKYRLQISRASLLSRLKTWKKENK